MPSTKLGSGNVKINRAGSLHSGSLCPESKADDKPGESVEALHMALWHSREATSLMGQGSQVSLPGRNATGFNLKYQAGGGQAKAMKERKMVIP